MDKVGTYRCLFWGTENRRNAISKTRIWKILKQMIARVDFDLIFINSPFRVDTLL